MKALILSISLLFSLSIGGQNSDNELNKFTPFIQALYGFYNNILQEKVYLHFDNTSYYQDNNIWFKCYVVTSGQHQLSPCSKTLYVELLNPGGEIIDKRILKVENGQCYGEFTLNRLPFYSGFYEVRAYTKYMMNFGEDIIFSRLLPVFEKPKTEGNFEEKKLMKYGRWGIGKYPVIRKHPVKGEKANLRFFPEGGNLVQGIASRVAFEATDEIGNPIDVTGIVMDADKQKSAEFTSLHEGKGVFTYTPKEDKRKGRVEIEYSRKKYHFDLPESLPQGIVMEVDNLSYSDSISITLRRNTNTPVQLLCVAVLCGGKLNLQNSFFIRTENEETKLQIDKLGLPSGIVQVVLFNSLGEILCDRLIFSNRHHVLNTQAKTNKPVYFPLERVELEMTVTDRDTNPAGAVFSLSVRDATDEVEYKHTILTDLLLMSEIKGYVRNPSYYFEKDDEMRKEALDVLLMVQGWRRYPWRTPEEIAAFDLKYLPEQGIETKGKIISLVREKPQPNVFIELFLYELEQNELEQKIGLFENCISDKDGNFSLDFDLSGKWEVVFNIREKGKSKDHRVLLDRVFSPAPKRYQYTDLQLHIADKDMDSMIEDDEETEDNAEDADFDLFLQAYNDSSAKLGVKDKSVLLQEVIVKAKKNSKEQRILYNRSTSVTHYDVPAELYKINDSGKYIGNDFYELLANMNKNFDILDGALVYKNKVGDNMIPKPPLCVVNYGDRGYRKVQMELNTIKSIYVSESISAMAMYAPNNIKSPTGRYSCVIFIETYRKGEKMPISNTKGIQKTMLEGYSNSAKEFYSPDYSVLPPATDYRRTLYWNPMVMPNEEGKATIQFYNNSNCKNFSISAEGITNDGRFLVYNNSSFKTQIID